MNPLKVALEATDPCPGIEELSRFAEGDPAAEPNRAITAHLSRCARCSAEMALLAEFETSASRPEEAAAVARITRQLEKRSKEIAGRPPVSGRWWSSLLAPARLRTASFALAGALLVISAGVYVRSTREPALDTSAAFGNSPVRAAGIEIIAPSGDVDAVPRLLRWSPAPGTTRYRVRVLEVDHTELWTAVADGSSIELPPSIRFELARGRALLWEVSGEDAAGKTTAESSAVRFRVRQ